MDLINFVSEDVHIIIDRKRGRKEYVGRLVAISRSFICLEVDGRLKWVKRPINSRDTVEKVNK